MSVDCVTNQAESTKENIMLYMSMNQNPHKQHLRYDIDKTHYRSSFYHS